MQKIVLVFLFFAVVALAKGDHGHDISHPPGMPKPLSASVGGARHFSQGVVNLRVARQLPAHMPSLEEMKHMGQEMINKLPPQMQEAVHKAQEMAKRMMQGDS